MALQHGFVFSFWLLNLFWRCVLLLLLVSDCMMPHDGVVVIRWSLVKILQKLASMDFLMARNGIATWICVFFLVFEFVLALCFVVIAGFWLHYASWWCSRNPLISGEDTPQISQHGFSDGKTWHYKMDLCFFLAFEFVLALCFVVIAGLWLHDASWWCSRNPLISGEDTPKISQHGFSDGKTWHRNMDLCFLSGFWICFGVVFCCYCRFLIALSLMMV